MLGMYGFSSRPYTSSVLRFHGSQGRVPCLRITSVFSTTAARLRRRSKPKHDSRAFKYTKPAELGKRPSHRPHSPTGRGGVLKDIKNGSRRADTEEDSETEPRLMAITAENLKSLKALSDLRYPVEWFPGARALQRTIHLHIGPTNSGKTYQALKRLEEADTGLYAGPLRLLAYEIFTRLNAKGKLCDLWTGDDRRIVGPNVAMRSCTVEMVPLNHQYDVAVIDEIQMISDPERGWAWTRALLGLQAKEIHLCGETRSESLIRHLVTSMGDKIEVHQHERLSPLKAMNQSLRGDWGNLRKGDALIVFSRKRIHAIRRTIENRTGKKCAVVYGSLPPETRAEQARLFNDPDNDYDILIASDAIGMGLNLSIKRIVFASAYKVRSDGREPLTIPEIKQIAGRAGRYRTANQALRETVISARPPAKSVGLVTTLEDADLPMVQHALATESKPLTAARILPPASVVQRFMSYFPPQTRFSYAFQQLHNLSQVHPHFSLSVIDDHLEIAEVIDRFQNLTVTERLIFCAAPIRLRHASMKEVTIEFARCVAEQRSGGLLEIPHLDLNILEQEPNEEKTYLEQLETLHLCLVLYIWLSYRFAGIFRTRALAIHVKEMVEGRINHVLVGNSVKNSPEQKSKPSTRFLSGDKRKFARSFFGSSGDLTSNVSSQTHPSKELISGQHWRGAGSENHLLPDVIN